MSRFRHQRLSDTPSREPPFGVYVFIVLCFAIAGGFFAYWEASMEAEAFNRVTGQHVSAWDAFWLELRVDGVGK